MTIDPMLETATIDNDFMTLKQYVSEGCDYCGGGSCNERVIENMSYIIAERCCCRVKKSELIFDKNLLAGKFTVLSDSTKIISMNLVLESHNELDSSKLNQLSLGGCKAEMVGPTFVRFNILNAYKNATDIFSLMLVSGSEDYTYRFNTNVEVELEYINYSYDRPTKKSYSLAGGAESVVDLHSGDVVTVFPATSGNDGIAVSGIHKLNSENLRCGNSFRLSLHEKLVENKDNEINADYVYTDSLGDVHLFKEAFYYINSAGEKVMIEKSDVSVKTDGSLYCIQTNGDIQTEYDVVKEQVSDSGWEAVTQLEDVKDIWLFEQRSDDEKQLQEQVDAYESALGEYKLYNKEGNAVYGDTPKAIYNAIPTLGTCVLVLSKNEIESYRSLKLQKESLANQMESCVLQQASYEIKAESLDSEIDANTSETRFDDVEFCNLVKQRLIVCPLPPNSIWFPDSFQFPLSNMRMKIRSI